MSEGFIEGSVSAEAVEGGAGGDDVFAIGLGGESDDGAGDVGVGEDAGCAEGGVEVAGAEEVAGFEGLDEVRHSGVSLCDRFRV